MDSEKAANLLDKIEAFIDAKLEHHKEYNDSNNEYGPTRSAIRAVEDTRRDLKNVLFDLELDSFK